eukprot:tig00000507_g1766.t1
MTVFDFCKSTSILCSSTHDGQSNVPEKDDILPAIWEKLQVIASDVAEIQSKMGFFTEQSVRENIKEKWFLDPRPLTITSLLDLAGFFQASNPFADAELLAVELLKSERLLVEKIIHFILNQLDMFSDEWHLHIASHRGQDPAQLLKHAKKETINQACLFKRRKAPGKYSATHVKVLWTQLQMWMQCSTDMQYHGRSQEDLDRERIQLLFRNNDLAMAFVTVYCFGKTQNEVQLDRSSTQRLVFYYSTHKEVN